MMSLVARAERDQARIVKEATKQANRECSLDTSLNFHERYEFWFRMEKKKAANAIHNMCNLLEDEEYSNAMDRLANLIATKAQNLKIGNSKQWYFITIRPDDTKCDIFEFKTKIETLLTRKCFVQGKYSFEQKAIMPNVEEMGKGFHCHIVCEMLQASKGQVLRDIKSTFSTWIKNGLITENNIDVRGTKNPDEIIEKYLLEYESDDNHKEVTRAMDELWRTSINLKRIYDF